MTEIRAFAADIHPNYQRGFQYQGNLDLIMVQLTNGIAEQEGLDEIWDEVLKVPRVIGYHYMRSGWSASAQVDAFLSVAEKLGGIHGYMVDGEPTGNVKGEAMAFRTKKVLDELIPLKPTSFYGGRYFIQDWLYPWTKFLVEQEDKYDLHIAQYPYVKWTVPQNEQMFEIDGGWSPVLPAGRIKWTWWQFSADGNKQGPKYGLPNPWYTNTPSIDLNVFNGTVKDLDKWLGLTEEEPEVPPAGEECRDLRVVAGKVLSRVWDLEMAAEELQSMLE